MPDRNLVSWSTLISSYSKVGFGVEALNCVRLMVEDGFDPNEYTYVSAVSECASLGAERSGKWKDFQSGANLEGLKIFSQSQKAGVKVNEFSCASVLGACAALECLEIGMQVHCIAIKYGIRLDQFVVTGSVNFYAKCDALDLARKAFREVDKTHLTAWTALIGGCVQCRKEREAIDLFCKLYASGGKLSEKTLASVLGAFSDANEIKVGKQLHSLILKLGFDSFTFVGNALLHFYSKSGLLEETLKIFEEMDVHDVVTWNALIAAHMKSGYYEEAVKLLRAMVSEGFELSLYTYLSILSICGDLPAFQWGEQTHCCIVKANFGLSVVVGKALIDMYAKCGRLSNAWNVFNNLSTKNLVSWNTMIVGYAQHGYGEEALEIYNMMQAFGVKPSDITFIGVLSACRHVGLLEKGLSYFYSMTKDYGITPRTDLLACMVSIFARKGQTQGAYDFIRSFSVDPDKVVWRCLLSGCKTLKDLNLGKYAAEKILNIDPDDTSALIMLSNIYAESKMWNETAQIRKRIKEKALKKDPGYSWTELNNKIYSFSAGHNAQYPGNSVHELLNALTEHIIDAGYVPGSMLSSPFR